MIRNITDEHKSKAGRIFGEDELDELFEEAVKIVTQYDRASASLIQRRLSIGYARAARLLDQLETSGIIGPADGSKPREVLIKNPADMKNIKRQKKNEYQAPILKYTKPKIGIIKKPKKNPWKKSLYDIVNDSSYKKLGSYCFPLGYSNEKLIYKNLSNFSHLSITGNASSNKEFLLDTIITSLILKLSHEDLKLVLIDTTKYLSFYKGIPHLLTPLISEAENSISALQWSCAEMNRRFNLFTGAKVRDIDGFNKTDKRQRLPRILIIINHFEEIFFFATAETGCLATRLASLGQKAGIHFILTSDRLTRAEVPIALQSNITNKIFFRLTSRSDLGLTKVGGTGSLDTGETLMLSESDNIPVKFDAVYTSDKSIKKIVQAIKK
ncbi:DNA translocase FtsK [Patescibacteria group bacterium]